VAKQLNVSQYGELDDKKLLTLIGVSWDRVALAELYNRYRLPLMNFIRREMSGTKLVEEVYNDVMLEVWTNASSFRGDSKVSTWIFGIAYRARLTHFWKESRHKHCGTGELTNDVQIEDESDLDDRTSINETLHAAIIELSRDHRAVIELPIFMGIVQQKSRASSAARKTR
jgi:RNA polymerase sigma-70 factor (ECF subfamily)